MIAPDTTTIDQCTQAEALHWLLANRRPEVSFETAFQMLSFSLSGDAKAQTVLEHLATEWRAAHALKIERTPDDQVQPEVSDARWREDIALVSLKL